MHTLTAARLADFLSLWRPLITVAMLWVGATTGPPAVGLVACLLILSWTSDSLDGPLARRATPGDNPHLGDYDLVFDIAVSGGLLGYLVLSRLVPWTGAAAYLAIWGLVFAVWGFNRSLGMLVQAPIYGWFLLISLREELAFGLAIVAWIAVAVILTWPRAPKEIIPGFLSGMQQLGHKD